MPAKKKNPLILESLKMEDFATEGRCIARWQGKAVFVERTVPGDVVDVYIYKNKKDWAEGYPLNFHELSSLRIAPFCSHFGVCGGCQWQMVPYEVQLRFKQQQVKDALQRIAGIPAPEISPILGAEHDKLYRNKLEYTFGVSKYIPEAEYQQQKRESASQTSGTGHPGPEHAAGFHAKGLFDKIVDIKYCHLQPEPSNRIREEIRAYAEKHNFTFYDVRKHEGLLRSVQLRICTTGEIMVNVIAGEENIPALRQMLEHLQQTIPQVTTWLYTINRKKNDSLHDLEPVVFSGKGYVTEKLEKFYFKIGPKSFFQTNTRQAEKLYSIVRTFCELSGKETVYDLYCGTGSIGIFVSEKAGRVVGIDLIEEAIADARENAKLNHLTNTAFFSGDVIRVCADDFFKIQGFPDVIITDPPRAGMHEKLVKKILDLEPPVLVYVSCNPATQARDLKRLYEKYDVCAVQPVDMFPHTHHIENVVQLKLRKP
ncbi:MAG: 23S rRNA (uracil(1939)-C(5))-methyltransferase RlmD [Chitinophagaceae bacterium]|nr:23S rRNA (uracil(1939)-C(5))-methyltransferase RlmD [Chitinophagaceae bacterium]